VLAGALEAEAKAMGTDVDLLPALDRDDKAFLRSMFAEKRNSLRTFRKLIGLTLGEKARSQEARPRVLH
jgi:hypothetical protein